MICTLCAIRGTRETFPFPIREEINFEFVTQGKVIHDHRFFAEAFKIFSLPRENLTLFKFESCFDPIDLK